jgi:hypothetical protein
VYPSPSAFSDPWKGGTAKVNQRLTASTVRISVAGSSQQNALFPRRIRTSAIPTVRISIKCEQSLRARCVSCFAAIARAVPPSGRLVRVSPSASGRRVLRCPPRPRRSLRTAQRAPRCPRARVSRHGRLVRRADTSSPTGTRPAVNLSLTLLLPPASSRLAPAAAASPRAWRGLEASLSASEANSCPTTSVPIMTGLPGSSAIADRGVAEAPDPSLRRKRSYSTKSIR